MRSKISKANKDVRIYPSQKILEKLYFCALWVKQITLFELFISVIECRFIDTPMVAQLVRFKNVKIECLILFLNSICFESNLNMIIKRSWSRFEIFLTFQSILIIQIHTFLCNAIQVKREKIWQNMNVSWKVRANR